MNRTIARQWPQNKPRGPEHRFGAGILAWVGCFEVIRDHTADDELWWAANSPNNDIPLDAESCEAAQAERERRRANDAVRRPATIDAPNGTRCDHGCVEGIACVAPTVKPTAAEARSETAPRVASNDAPDRGARNVAPNRSTINPARTAPQARLRSAESTPPRGPDPTPAHRPARKPSALPVASERDIEQLIDDLGGLPQSQHYQALDDFAAAYAREYARRFGG